jgi:hypothetical protein
VQVYMKVGIYLKDDIWTSGIKKGTVNTDYTADLSEVYSYFNRDGSDGWQRSIYTFPQMIEVTKAQISIS